MKTTCIAAAAILLFANPVLAGFDLRVTEMWPGNEPGENLTDDWFEITNFGDTAWTAAADGDLYFDDSGPDIANADLMAGIASIAPGESVVYVNGSPTPGGLNTNVWSDLWGPALTAAGRSLPQVGTYDGSGFGQGGDETNIWISLGLPVGAPNFSASYPDAGLNGGQSFDSVLGAFTTIGVATAVNDMGQPAIGTPGYIAIPEPTSLILVVLGAVYCAARRR